MEISNINFTKEEFLRKFCGTCTACRIYCPNKCEVAKYAESRYEKCATKYIENDKDMKIVYDYVKDHLRRKYA